MVKNKKGQTVGTFITLIIGIIACVVLLVAVAQQKGTMTDLSTVANASLGTMTNGTALYITDYKYCSGFKIFNATNDVEIPSTNYTVTNNVVYNGNEAIQVDPAVTVTAGVAFNKGTATYQGTCQPLTYDNNSAGRTIIDLVVLFSALAIVVFVLEKSGVTNLFGRD